MAALLRQARRRSARQNVLHRRPERQENVSNFNITCIVDVERDQLTEVENKIFQLAENRGGIEVFSISDIITYLQEEMDNIKMPLYGLVFFIAVFGLISLINTLMTNIISRQQEFGILSETNEGAECRGRFIIGIQ